MLEKRKRNTEILIKYLRISFRILGGFLACYTLFRFNYHYGISTPTQNSQCYAANADMWPHIMFTPPISEN